MEKLYYPGELAKKSGIPAETIRAACRREDGYNRLPHIESGEVRPTFRIAESDFEKWLEKEKNVKVDRRPRSRLI